MSARDREPAGDWRLPQLGLLAVAAGCLVGLGEVAAVGVRHYVRGEVTHITPDVVWMAPLVYAVLFTACAIPIALHPAGRRSPAAATFAFSALGLGAWIAMTPWGLHPVAIVVLAAGIAFQLARAAGRHAARLRRVLRRSAPVLVLLVAGGAAALLGWRRSEERGALASLGPAPDGPNVILLILDTVRARSLGLYGAAHDDTPELEAFARSAVVFDRAQSTAPWTLPSHASMFTGRWPHELSVGWSTPLDDAEPTLAERLAGRGYATAGFVANLSYGARAYGLSRGFAHWEDFPVSVGQAILATSLGRHIASWDLLRAALDDHELLNRKTASDIRGSLLRWIDRRPDRPFFVFANFFDAHEPYEPPPALRRRYVGDYRRTNVEHRHNLLRGVNARRLEKWATPPEDVPRELGLYEAAIASIDAELGGLFRDLEMRGLLANSLVVVAGDHGEQFGEHGLWDHMQSLYQPLVHVPLVIRPPGGLRAQMRVELPVTLRDLPATILDVVPADGSPGLPGSSLAPLWEGAGEGETVRLSPALSELHQGLVERSWYPIASGQDMLALLADSLFYICNPRGTEELYDVAADPDESENLAGTRATAGALHALRVTAASLGAPPTRCPPPADEPPRLPDRVRRPVSGR